MQARTAWRILGIAATEDVSAVRRAYAAKLRATDVDADPAGFARLRDARDVALQLARSIAEKVPDEPDGHEESPFDRILPIVSFGRVFALYLDRSKPLGAVETVLRADPVPQPLQPLVARDGERRSIPLDVARLSLVAPLLDCDDSVGTIVEAPATDHFDTASRTIVSLLYPVGAEHVAPFSSDEIAAIDAALDVVLADPRLDELAFHANAERWFGDILSDAIPRSDPMLYRVAERLGWLEDRNRIGLAPGTERVLDRIETLIFVSAVDRPDHRLHEAWRELTKPAMEKSRRSFFVSGKRVKELLTLVRTRHPDAEDYFDFYRVALWEPRQSVSGPSWWIGILIAIALLRLFASLGTTPTDPTAIVNTPVTQLAVGQSAPLRDVEDDLDLALLSIANGFTATLVKRGNPDLYVRLAERWRTAKSAGTPMAAFLSDTRKYLYDRLDAAIPRAGYDDIAAWRRQELIELKAVGSRGAEACDLYLKGDFDPGPFLSESTRLERHALVSRILLADNGPDPSARRGERTFRIAAPIIEKLQDKTKLTDAAMTAALRGKGNADSRCRIRDALLEIALDLPRTEGTALLRKM